MVLKERAGEVVLLHMFFFLLVCFNLLRGGGLNEGVLPRDPFALCLRIIMIMFENCMM